MQVVCPYCGNLMELVQPTSGEVLCPNCGSTLPLVPAPTASLRPPRQERLGRFEILETLGQGTFGTVYKARDPELDRVVAIKVPRAGDLTGAADLGRFLREARSVARLRHAGIVPVHEVGQADGLPFLVCEFVPGVTLDDRLAVHAFAPRQAAELVATLAETLDYAHRQGVVHRDVKPSNIMLGDNGTLYLMDFGLAKRDAGDTTMTVEGQILGTPAYMSPEQAGGEAHRVDGRSDVYSLGVVLYRLLTGELPFRGNRRMLLHQVLHEEPRSPRALNDQVARDLETICLKAMAKLPSQRYATAAGLADDLRRFLKGEPIRARPVTLLERARRWVRRRPAVASLLAALVCVIVGSMAGLTALWLHADERRQQADEARAEEQKAKVAAQQNYQEARRNYQAARLNLYVSNIQLAHRAWQEGKVPQVLELLQGGPLREGDTLHRGFEWAYLRRLCNTELLALEEKNSFLLAYSPDGRWLASAGNEAIRIREATMGRVVRTLPHMPSIRGMAFSPDSRLFASASAGDREIRLWDVDAGKELPLPRPAMPDKGVKLMDVKGKVLPMKHDLVHGLAFSPDGQLLAITEGRYVVVFEKTTGKQIAAFFNPPRTVLGRGFPSGWPAGRRGGRRVVGLGSRLETPRFHQARATSR
jgi:tRNA A-37 threonylcarbamoyl transferase component Bud32